MYRTNKSTYISIIKINYIPIYPLELHKGNKAFCTYTSTSCICIYISQELPALQI